MMLNPKSLGIFGVLAAVVFASIGCSGTRHFAHTELNGVRTTAYSHLEKDSLPYGRGSAAGGTLKYGKVRSAAADWSRYPVGTVFKIEGDPHVYEVDDYGSALVGTSTIDIYKPTMTQMRAWGVRHVDIKVLRWGSYERSYDILKDRTKASHVREMVKDIKPKVS
jgi:3D (Asp-Asp-Asp) domain-containing protein